MCVCVFFFFILFLRTSLIHTKKKKKKTNKHRHKSSPPQLITSWIVWNRSCRWLPAASSPPPPPQLPPLFLIYAIVLLTSLHAGGRISQSPVSHASRRNILYIPRVSINPAVRVMAHILFRLYAFKPDPKHIFFYFASATTMAVRWAVSAAYDSDDLRSVLCLNCVDKSKRQELVLTVALQHSVTNPASHVCYCTKMESWAYLIFLFPHWRVYLHRLGYPNLYPNASFTEVSACLFWRPHVGVRPEAVDQKRHYSMTRGWDSTLRYLSLDSCIVYL